MEKTQSNIVSLEIGSFSSTLPFYRERHLHFIRNLANKLDGKHSYEGAVTEHLRMSGIYWTYTALSLLVSPPEANVILGIHPSSSSTSIHHHSSPFIIIHHSSFIIHHSSFIIHHSSSFIIQHSSSIIHHSSLIVPHSSQIGRAHV